MKVLIATDGSEQSDYAIEDTIKLSWSQETEFKVIAVVDNSFGGNETQTATAQKLVDASIEKLNAALPGKNKVSGQVLHGYPKSEIVKCAEYWPADTIVMGSRGRKGLKRVVLGSVSHSVLVAANCSVRIARKTANNENLKIAVAFDDSPTSDIIIDRICQRTWAKNAQFFCLTAVPSLAQEFFGVQDSHEIRNLESAKLEKISATKKQLEKISKTLQAKIPHASVSYQVLEGDPREAIIEKAEELNAGLIIVGQKGKNWMDRLLIGSVSEAIATWADCSVLVVK